MKKQLLKKQENQDSKKSTSLINYYTEGLEPFTIIETEEEIKITLGQYLIKKGYSTVEEAKREIYKKSWDMILRVTAVNSIFINEIKDQKNDN